MRTQRNRRGFTLVEILVVIVIIGILTTMLFRLHSIAGERAARAQTLQRIENIKLCIEEYYRVYGQYPPQSSDPVGHGTEFQGFYASDLGFFPDEWREKLQLIEDQGLSFMSPGYTGLLYHISAHPDVNYTHSESAQWREYWDGGVGFHDDHLVRGNLADLGIPDIGSGEVTNRVFRLHDGWWHQFVYKCTAPYQSYELYSIGASASDPDDDIGRIGFAE